MVNILVVTHGDLAEHILTVAEHILNIPRSVVPVCLNLKEDPGQWKKQLEFALDSVDKNQGVLILTDLFGGTPSNISVPFVKKGTIEVLTGLNLSMVLYVLSKQNKTDFESLYRGARKAAREAILIAGDFL